VLATFIIFLREGVEAAMIVAILLAYLRQLGQTEHFRDVAYGVTAAFVLTLAGGVGAYFTIAHYAGSRVQLYFETVTYVVAAVFLTLMALWMHQHARTMAGELRARSDAALSAPNRWGLRLLAFQSVGREGLETMVFTLAILFANSHQSATPVHDRLVIVGALAGLAVAMVLAVMMYRLGTRINLGVFFRVLGVVLTLFAAGLVADAVENFQQLGWMGVGTHVVWNTASVLNQSSNAGDVAHSLLGYADRPTILQLLAWGGYVAASLGVARWWGRHDHARRRANHAA